MNKTERQIGKRIKELRERYEYSQEKLAKLLKVERTTLSAMENGNRAIKARDLKRLSEIFQCSIDSLLNLNKPSEVILTESKAVREEKTQIRISVPQKNLEKFKEVLLYILNKVGSKPNIGETVIYKLLYFIDFDFYEKYEDQLIGATYLKNTYGPTPIEFQKIVERMTKDGDVEKVKSEYYNFPQTKYLPLREPDLSKLSGNEKELIDDVLNRLSNMTAKQISDYSHQDVPWLTTEDGEIIEYEPVFYRTQPYTVREYSEESQDIS